MTLDISVPEQQPIVLLTPKITVIGVGGAGGNAINNMIQTQLGGVNFVVANTDAQALNSSLAETKIQLGIETTHGQGAGARPEVGRESAEEALDDISAVLDGANMVFITAGMGGGTGTGAAPVFAKMARERDILTVGVVTKPFTFEGRHRMAIAEQGIEELAQYVDTLIVIPNQNLFLVADEKMTFAEAFKKADQVLQGGVRSITDLIITPGIINLDFSDVRAVMAEMGRAMMGTGMASGENRALEAAEEAIANPLLDDASMTGAKGILINIAGGADLTLFEVDEAANRIRREVDPEANIIFGASFDDSLEGSIRVSVVATGISRQSETQNPFMMQTAATPSIFTQPKAQSKPFTPTFSAPRHTVTETPAPVSEPVPEAVNPEENDNVLDIEDTVVPPPATPVHPTVASQPISFSPKTVSNALPAMPAPNELFGSEDARQPASFETFTPKMTVNERPQPTVSLQEAPVIPPIAEVKAPEAPAPATQEDLFSEPVSVTPPPVIPPAIKPAEKSKPSLFHFVTGRRAAEDKKAEIPSNEESDIPSFLRQH
ncbi:MAG: cell division protein FtsZ [Alphaproteobacteria bacterium]|nr:cell division protein FtsZ [Alphaproteobacteria bacterium]MBO4643040.1 cell division protein FtsZ [Alphaproteobacteria bacterium]